MARRARRRIGLSTGMLGGEERLALLRREIGKSGVGGLSLLFVDSKDSLLPCPRDNRRRKREP